MLLTGNQLKAARALAELDQTALAKAAGLNVNTIRNMEASGNGPIAGRAVNVRAVQVALERAGVEFIPENGGGAGVRPQEACLRPTPEHREEEPLDKSERIPLGLGPALSPPRQP